MTQVMHVSAAPRSEPADQRILQILQAPILPLLLRMAWPNMLIMLVQAATGLIETWWVAKLGTDELAGMALVFPPYMLMTMISAGAIGGAISSAVARALGAGNQDEANSLLLHAVVINVLLGLACCVVFLLASRPLYQLLGGHGNELETAVLYSNTVFSGVILIWLMNGLSSVIRGTGEMMFPAMVICVGAVLLLPLSPLLIFGYGPVPGLGIVGGGVALIVYFAGGTCAMAWYLLSGRTVLKFRWTSLQLKLLQRILSVGGISTIMSIQTNVVIAGTTALVASVATVEAVAGFGTATRLEYLLVPVVFGIGAPMVALVGVNVGAGKRDRALAIGLTGGFIAFGVTELIGVLAALWPVQWLQLFSNEPQMIEVGTAYLRTVGPVYGFFGLGLSLYFASQGAGRLRWPFISGLVRMIVALAGGWGVLTLTGSLDWLFAAVAVGLLAYGLITFLAVRSGAWFQ
ncbi:MATE family efflux transporter [Pseudomonas monteilii]|nr:MATE family efflux transporter [Pseudomonas monteilii]